MLKVRICEDLEEAERIWRAFWPQNHIFDLWDVRACFQGVYGRRPHFLIAEENGGIHGFLALSWIEEEEYFGHFPGETYQGKTWLEQNRILARDSKVLRALFKNIPVGTRLRYLIRDSILFGNTPPVEDETGYVFFPGNYDYRFETYFQDFSPKSRKKLGKEMERFHEAGVTFRYDHFQDLDTLFQMNLEGFGDQSFFSHPGFFRSFEQMLLWLYERGLLRITTVLVNGEVAAVDAGSVWKDTYTVLAGGVNREFPGIAKVINFHHMDWACRSRMKSVDFLCGDFGWKERFHLSPRPLYKIEAPSDPAVSRMPRTSYYVRKQ